MNRKVYGGKSAAVTIAVFSLIFVVCCGVCVTFFAKAAVWSGKASSLNDAVQICRNAAQVYSEKKSAEETVKALGGGGKTVYLDGDFAPADENTATYVLQCEELREDSMLYGEFSVFDMSGKEIYTLRLGVFDGEAS